MWCKPPRILLLQAHWVNAVSLEKVLLELFGRACPEAMVESRTPTCAFWKRRLLEFKSKSVKARTFSGFCRLHAACR